MPSGHTTHPDPAAQASDFLHLHLFARGNHSRAGASMECACTLSRRRLLPMPTTRTPTSLAPATRYDRVAVALHWLLALLLFTSFCVGVYMADLPLSPTRVRL